MRLPVKLRMLGYGLVFLAVLLGGLPLLALRLDAALPALNIEVGLWRLLGAALFLACFVGYVSSAHILSSRGEGPYVEFDPPRKFVASGPYRWVRNPIVICVCGMLLGLAFALSSTVLAIFFLISLPVAYLQVVRLEEPLLRQRFGAAYEDYCRRVPRWLPKAPGSDED